MSGYTAAAGGGHHWIWWLAALLLLIAGQLPAALALLHWRGKRGRHAEPARRRWPKRKADLHGRQ